MSNYVNFLLEELKKELPPEDASLDQLINHLNKNGEIKMVKKLGWGSSCYLQITHVDDLEASLMKGYKPYSVSHSLADLCR